MNIKRSVPAALTSVSSPLTVAIFPFTRIDSWSGVSDAISERGPQSQRLDLVPAVAILIGLKETITQNTLHGFNIVCQLGPTPFLVDRENAGVFGERHAGARAGRYRIVWGLRKDGNSTTVALRVIDIAPDHIHDPGRTAAGPGIGLPSRR